ncbi:MAG: glycosyltransferase family 2 protein [Candidatus Nanopelagicales bacterium]|nr:glycosyltransferase family 2 protein [Candidatus Nanopelagicales bacterium]
MSEPAGAVTIDVLLPTTAPAPWLAETLDGLNAQVGCTWRLVAVVHGDASVLTPIILAKVPTALVLPMPPEARLQDLLNAGLAACTAPYVARQDHDDIPEPTRLAAQRDFLDAHPSVVAVGCAATLIDEHGVVMGSRRLPVGAQVLRGLRWKSMLVHPSVMMRREPVLGAGGYDPGTTHAEDYELWLRLAAIGDLDNLEAALLRYRVHAQQVSRAKGIPHATRVVVARSRRALARARGESVIFAQLRQAVWAAPQIVRSIRRR